MKRQIKIITIGASAGGIDALKLIFSRLHHDFNIPVLAVLHVSSENGIADLLNRYSSVYVCTPDDKDIIERGRIYIAPADYHMLVESERIISLNIEKKINYCRPSIDVLFESASFVFKEHIMGVLLTGSNNDGASGIAQISRNGGLTVIENPETAMMPVMPESGIEMCTPDFIGSLEEISDFFNKIFIDQTGM